jgi:hypothetical protein
MQSQGNKFNPNWRTAKILKSELMTHNTEFKNHM